MATSMNRFKALDIYMYRYIPGPIGKRGRGGCWKVSWKKSSNTGIRFDIILMFDETSVSSRSRVATIETRPSKSIQSTP